MEDSRIIELYFNRDQEAIATTEEKYGAYCFSVAERILQNAEDAEECVSDTYLRVWNSIPPKKPRFLKLFLAGITRNLAIDRYNAKNTDKRGGGEASAVLDELSECIAAKGDIAADYEGKELGESISKFIKTLPERDGNIFLRRYFFTEPIAFIAEKYGLRENNVTVILLRTRKKLKAHLIKEGYFDEKH